MTNTELLEKILELAIRANSEGEDLIGSSRTLDSKVAEFIEEFLDRVRQISKENLHQLIRKSIASANGKKDGRMIQEIEDLKKLLLKKVEA